MAIASESPTVKDWQYPHCQVSVVVKLGCVVSVFGAKDPADHGTVIAAEPLQFMVIWSPRLTTVEYSRANTGSYTLPHILGEGCLMVRTGINFLNFPQATQHFHVKHGAVDIHNEPSLAITAAADIAWAGYQSFSDATAPRVDPHYALWALDGYHHSGQYRGYLLDFFRTSWPTPETRSLVFFMLTQNPLLSMPAFHDLSL